MLMSLSFGDMLGLSKKSYQFSSPLDIDEIWCICLAGCFFSSIMFSCVGLIFLSFQMAKTSPCEKAVSRLLTNLLQAADFLRLKVKFFGNECCWKLKFWILIMMSPYYPENTWASGSSTAVLGTLQYFMLLNGNPESLNESLILKNIYAQETMTFSETD